MLADRGQREAASQAALQTLLSTAARQRQEQQYQQQQEIEARRYQDALAQQEFQNRRLMVADDERQVDRRNSLDYQNRLLDYYKTKASAVTPTDLRRQEADALKELEFMAENDLPIDPQLVERSGSLGRAMFNAIGQKRQKQAEDIALAEEAATVGNRLNQIKKDATAIDPKGKDWRSKAMMERIAPFLLRYGPLLDAKAGYVKTDTKTGKLVRAIDTPAWMEAESAKAKNEKATAKGTMPLPFYDRVNALISSGLAPAQAKAQALSEFSAPQ